MINGMDMAWTKKFNYDLFVTPIEIKKDNQYYGYLKNKLEELEAELIRTDAPKIFIDVASDYKDKLMRSLDCYYRGDIIDAQNIINDIIDEFEDDTFAISNVCESIAFPKGKVKEVQFFRSRLNDRVVDYSAEEMLHIPFFKRSLVESERFSIPGVPCLYLGNSSYVCWIEMGCPAEHEFNVSPVLLDDTQKVLNLAVSIRTIFDITQKNPYNIEINEDNLILLFKLLILSISTSFRTKEKQRNFKSEYIISQMIMLASKKKGLDGILYYSKQVFDDVFAIVVGINLVLFAPYNGEEMHSTELMKHVKTTDSFNYSMFKQLLAVQNNNDYPLKIDTSPYIKNIGTFKRQFPYHETQFYEFDKYLFANWDRE